MKRVATKQPIVRIQRTISAPPGQVYRAWLDPDLLCRWMAPGDFTVTQAEVDERVGGRYRIFHADPDGGAGGFECEILELVPHERLVFRWGFVGPERTAGPVFDSRLIIILRELPGGKTELTLLHEHLDALASAMPDVADSVQDGWEWVLEKLDALLRGRP